ncbi:hypothetical protein [Myroides sp. LJL119]
MDKQNYTATAIEKIKAKNLSVPFTLVQGSIVRDLDLYLKSLQSAYIATKDPRLNNLFKDKFEQLINL